MNSSEPALNGLSTAEAALLLAYAAICLIIGIMSHRKKDAGGYMIGGRQLKTIGFVFSVLASYIGGAAVVAYAAYVYRFGPPAFAVLAGTALGFLVFIPYALKIKKKPINSSLPCRDGSAIKTEKPLHFFPPSSFLWFILA